MAEIASVPSTLKRAKKNLCSHCGKIGAALDCNTQACRLSYHFECAVELGCTFKPDKRIYCATHKSSKAASKGVDWPPLEPVDRFLCVQKKFSQETFDPPSEHWIRCGGGLTVIDAGRMPPARGDPPDGFLAHRMHWSMVAPNELCQYRLSIRHMSKKKKSSAPREVEFEIVCEDAPEQSIRAASADEALRLLTTALFRTHPGIAKAKAMYPYEAGYFFGWSFDPVQRRLHGDPNAPSASDDKAAEVLPINKNSCARCLPIERWATHTNAKKMRLAMGSEDAMAAEKKRDESDGPEKVEGAAGIGEQIRSLNGLARSRFKVARSGIHGWGYARPRHLQSRLTTRAWPATLRREVARAEPLPCWCGMPAAPCPARPDAYAWCARVSSSCLQAVRQGAHPQRRDVHRVSGRAHPQLARRHLPQTLHRDGHPRRLLHLPH